LRDENGARRPPDAETADKIKNLLLRETDIYRTLRKMASRELEAILLDADMEELLQILEEKQEVISRLRLLADTWADATPLSGLPELRGTPGFWKKVSGLFPEEQAAELRQILSETRAAAEDLMEVEKKVQEELEKHVRFLRGKILAMKHGRSAFASYAKMGGGYLDLGS
jgi:hypothetical protein